MVCPSSNLVAESVGLGEVLGRHGDGAAKDGRVRKFVGELRMRGRGFADTVKKSRRIRHRTCIWEATLSMAALMWRGDSGQP